MSNDDARQPAELRQFLERYPDTRQLELLQPDIYMEIGRASCRERV